LEEIAQDFVKFLQATEDVAEGGFSQIITNRLPDGIAVSLEGTCWLTSMYQPVFPEDPKYAEYLDDDMETVNETLHLSHFIRLASEVIIEPADDGMRRITLVFRDK